MSNGHTSWVDFHITDTDPTESGITEKTIEDLVKDVTKEATARRGKELGWYTLRVPKQVEFEVHAALTNDARLAVAYTDSTREAPAGRI